MSHAGNELEQVVRESGRRLVALAWRLTGNRADAEDFAQEALLRLHQSGVPAAEAWPWLRRVVVNLVIDRARRPVRFAPMPELSTAADSPEALASKEQQYERLRVALTRLGDRERTALVLRDIEGLTTAQVAAEMGTAEATVRVQIARARLKLREYLQ